RPSCFVRESQQPPDENQIRAEIFPLNRGVPWAVAAALPPPTDLVSVEAMIVHSFCSAGQSHSLHRDKLGGVARLLRPKAALSIPGANVDGTRSVPTTK